MSQVQNIETDGGTLAVQVQGQGPLVVCSPGMGDSRDAFDPLAAQLVAKGYSVALVDLRGHGDSSVQFDSYGDEATAKDFVTVVEKLGRGRAVLAGVSLSAGAATIAAGKRPDLVAGLILLGPYLRNPMGSFGMALMPTLFWKPWGPTMWKMYAKTLWPGLGDQAGARAAKSADSLARPGRYAAFRATVAGANHATVTPWLGKVKAPVLVVMGDKDPDWSKPLDEAAWVASNFSDVKNLTVPGAGHAPMLESPEVVGGAVVEFLGELKQKGAFK